MPPGPRRGRGTAVGTGDRLPRPSARAPRARAGRKVRSASAPLTGSARRGAVGAADGAASDWQPGDDLEAHGTNDRVHEPHLRADALTRRQTADRAPRQEEP